MMKIKLLTSVLVVLAAVGIVTAAEVINVDIKGYGNDTPYVGNGAYDVGPNTVWTVYYGGWGMPVGSCTKLRDLSTDVMQNIRSAAFMLRRCGLVTMG